MDESAIDTVIDRLVNNGVLLRYSLEVIRSTVTTTDKMRTILDVLPKRGPDAFKHFIAALTEAGLSYMVDHLIQRSGNAEKESEIKRQTRTINETLNDLDTVTNRVNRQVMEMNIVEDEVTRAKDHQLAELRRVNDQQQPVERVTKCKVCQDRDINVALNCGHILCTECCTNVRARNLPCPFCRTLITNVITVYV